jgi:hypothetical protein
LPRTEFFSASWLQQRNLGLVLALEQRRQLEQQTLQLLGQTKLLQVWTRQCLNLHRPKQLPVVPSNA